MQTEDIIRLREQQHVDKSKQLESQQQQLIDELNRVIKRKSVVANEHFNMVLSQAIQLVNKS